LQSSAEKREWQPTGKTQEQCHEHAPVGEYGEVASHDVNLHGRLIKLCAGEGQKTTEFVGDQVFDDAELFAA
jgi:hypothetical protein